jgi:hypothetical protein
MLKSWITDAGAIITVLGIIGLFISKMKYRIRGFFTAEIEKKIDDLSLQQLRQVVYTEGLSVIERDKAYQEYARRGGNGYTTEYYRINVQPLITQIVYRNSDPHRHQESE